MNNANREKLVALGYSPDSLTSKDIDRINQALAASSVTLGQVTELIDIWLRVGEPSVESLRRLLGTSSQ